MSSHSKLEAHTRSVIGNRVKVLRREGFTPGIVYSASYNSTPVQVNANELKKVYKVSGKSNVIDLKIDGKVQPVIIKDVDAHPFKPVIRHVDFLAVDLKTEVTSLVPLQIVGEAPVKKELGGILNQVKYEVEVTALPDDMPDHIDIDVTSLVDFSSSISVGDISASKKYSISEDPEILIVSVIAQSEEAPEEDTTTDEAATEGEETATSETPESN